VNETGTTVRVRLVGYDFASREPIDIQEDYSVSLPRLAMGEYVLVVHSRVTQKVLLGLGEPIKIPSQNRGSTRQTKITLKKGKEGKYQLQIETEPFNLPKYGKPSDKK
jgi:hypothetical protein